ARHRARYKWSSVIYNYRLILRQQNTTAPLPLNPQWATPLFKALQTQNKLHQSIRRYLGRLLQFKPDHLVGPHAVFGRSMRAQVLGQLNLAVQALQEHRDVLPFFEDSFWPQLQTSLYDLSIILKQGASADVHALQLAQNKILVALHKHSSLLPREVFQDEREAKLPEKSDHPTAPPTWPTDLFSKLEKLYNRLQNMTYFVHPYYTISPGERFLLQLLTWRNWALSTDQPEGDYYQTIREVYTNLPYSDGEIAQLFLKLQQYERQRNPALTSAEQISIPQYQYWQEELRRYDKFNVATHQIYKELFVTFWDAAATIHHYPSFELQPYRKLLRQVLANLDKVFAFDYQWAVPLHKRELEYLWHAEYVRDIRHQILP
ncbi:MAG: hypothetical protein J6Y94_01660, partial [Bacteriovoracaceae bacterium]|nr:hypothetical protein [Bacteriovoracaceae bacterium]